MQQILQSYLRRLTNLSSNNRSLLLLRSGSEQFIDIHDFDFALSNPSFHVIDQLIAQKDKIPLCPLLDSRDDESNVLSRKLKRMQRLEKFIFEERGGKDLYVGWPFVRGKFADDSVVRCPLMFFPVDINLVGDTWQLNPRKNVNITLNKSFLLAYSHFNQVKLDEELLERVFDDFDRDSRVFRTSLYELFRESNIELNFNQENFSDRLYRFEHFKKSDLENLCHTGELKLYPEAILGIFPQAGSYLVPDYLKMIDDNPINSIEEFFVSKTMDEDKASIDPSRHSESFLFLDRIREEQTFTPFDMDAYQENAIKAVKSGNSVVIQGPPGTGKSQLICNLISDYIARGLNVLLVCQKRAALDVVYQRLQEKDATDFVGLVHDFKNDRKDIYEQIANQIDRLSEYRQKNNSLDAIQLERQFLQISRKIDQLTEDLDEYKKYLFDENECGKSIKELYLSSNPDFPVINLKQDYKEFAFNEDLEEYLSKLGLLASYGARFESDSFPWHHRKSFAGLSISDLKKIQTFVERIPKVKATVSKSSKQITGKEIDLDDSTAIYKRKDDIQEMLNLLKDETVYQYFKHLIAHPDKDTDSLWFSNQERTIMDCYKGVGPEISQDSSNLGRLQESLHKGMQARKSLFRWFKWKLFSKEKILISRVLVANQLQSNKKGFGVLVQKVDNRLNLEHNITRLRGKEWLTDIPKSLLKIDMQNWFYYQKRALKAKLIFSSLRNFQSHFNLQKLTYSDFREQTESLINVIGEIYEEKNSWSAYLTDVQINKFAEDDTLAGEALTSLSKNFDSLVDYDTIQASLKPYEKSVLEKLKEESQDISEDSYREIFLNSLKMCWIEHIETKYPVLTSVSSLRFEKLESELQEAVREKLEISNEILLLKARERTYQNLEFNRLNNVITYRDLNHQVTKKRRIWPVRKVISNFHKEVFDLIPCWMASPEASSAIFPMDVAFDLVIFDEASQCFAERGLPAMFRGRQVVVTGDDKQLKPNDLYRIRWEDENEEDLPELVIDSLLNLAKQHLMQVRLRGHYRSKSVDLINFSNHYFYDEKLRVLPDYHDVNAKVPAIDYIKVDGMWEKNTNPLEAEVIVDLVMEYIKKAPEKEIGIITFNAQQQNLVLDLIEEKAAAKSILIPQSLIVKNIENVQGDEKDVIIFSIGYAPDKSGKMQMQFGSLNQEGGENRLNVAVTRSREKVIIVSSIHPVQLKVEKSKNDGPKLLKSYLEYALKISQGERVDIISNNPTFNYDWYLKYKLSTLDIPELSAYFLSEELPFADLTVKKDKDYTGLIMTDDNLYFSSVSAKQAHAYWPFIMARKNWPFTNFHSREYWLNREESREKLIKFLNRAGVDVMKR